MRRRIVFIVGTRPEFIKVVPVYKVFKKDNKWEAILVSTGQHASMLTQLYDFFEVKPDFDLALMKHDQSLGSLSSLMLDRLGNLFSTLCPEYILVQGDTTTTFISSLLGFYYKVPVLHLEAGLRTNNKYSPFPEEVNRRLTSNIAEIHFCPTEEASNNLLRENITTNIHIVGNTVIDSLLWAKSKVEKAEDEYIKRYFKLLNDYDRLILITAHRRESFDGGIRQIIKAIRELAARYTTYSFAYPVHLNPNVRDIVYRELSDISNVFLLEPLNYDDMVFLMKSSYIILTDSGGIQEEAPSLNVPVIVLRESTERMEAVEAGSCILAGSNSIEIILVFENLISDQNKYAKMAQVINPYGAGNSAGLVHKILED